MKKYILGALAIVLLAIAYPVIGFYIPPEEPVPAPRAESTPLDNFCTDAQKFVTDTDITAKNRFYTEFGNFTASKPSIDENELIISQHVLYDKTDSGREYAKLVSCKFKSSDRIQIVRGDDAAGEEKSCKDINQQTVNSVLARITLQNPPNIILEEDELEERGSNWVQPWPSRSSPWAR